jgi:hypothetical protein
MMHRDRRYQKSGDTTSPVVETGTLVVDRVFPAVGRIKRASGTNDPVIKRKIDAMLTRLADDGMIDLLRGIRDRRLTLLEVHDAYQRRALDQLPSGSTARPLAPAMRAWLAHFTCSPKHRGSIEYSIRYMERRAPKALIADVARVVEDLRINLGRGIRGHGTSSARTRRHSSARR